METALNLMTSSAVLNTSLTSEAFLLSSPGQQRSSSRQTELDEMRAFTVLLVQKVLMPLVVLVGCAGNTINITVLTRPSMRSSTNCYLTALAVCDMLYLLFAFTMSLKHYKQVAITDAFVIYKTYLGKTFTDIWSNTGIWLTVTFTVERYIVVCHPMKGQVWCTPNNEHHPAVVSGHRLRKLRLLQVGLSLHEPGPFHLPAPCPPRCLQRPPHPRPGGRGQAQGGDDVPL